MGYAALFVNMFLSCMKSADYLPLINPAADPVISEKR
jgi:hypothetical protein